MGLGSYPFGQPAMTLAPDEAPITPKGLERGRSQKLLLVELNGMQVYCLASKPQPCVPVAGEAPQGQGECSADGVRAEAQL